MIVCCCRAVSDRHIVDAVQRGACTPEAIAACTGAGTRCGSCRAEVAALIHAHAPDSKRHLSVASADLDPAA